MGDGPAKTLHPTYRADIDGLRAVAILSVVLYHAFPKLIPGGFVGVDIFFVISGYLISGIILANLERGSFSVLDFYKRRIRRIFPALIVVLLVVIVCGWFTLLREEIRYLGKHLFVGGVFLSNWALYRESGYFDQGAYAKPLLHLWSLAIEEQFYIFWPLMLAGVWRFRFRFTALMGVIAVTSFAANIYWTYTNIDAAFYSPISRFWELMVGGILAYAAVHRFAGLRRFTQLQAIAGAACIIAALLAIKPESRFPGLWALLPTGGAALLISAGPSTVVNRWVLANPVAVFIGLISYPLYLWHWPLMSLANIVILQTTNAIMATTVVASGALAWITYRFIECPVRRQPMTNTLPAALAAVMACICFVGIGLNWSDGLAFRQVVKLNRDPALAYEGGVEGEPIVKGCDWVGTPTFGLIGSCVRDGRGPLRYALVGDSKALALLPGLIRTSSEAGRWEAMTGNALMGAPLPVVSSSPAYKRHMEVSSAALTYLRNTTDVRVVVFTVAARTLFNLRIEAAMADLPGSRHYSTVRDSLRETTQGLVASGKKVVFVVDNPALPDPEKCTQRRTAFVSLDRLLGLEQHNLPCHLKLATYLQRTQQYRAILTELSQRSPGNVFAFETMPYLCDSRGDDCPAYQNDRPLYGSTDHMSDYAAGLVGRGLNQYLAETVDQPTPPALKAN
jgi:peptidoglycan/LPS O-acetylase OafA/YrhL